MILSIRHQGLAPHLWGYTCPSPWWRGGAGVSAAARPTPVGVYLTAPRSRSTRPCSPHTCGGIPLVVVAEGSVRCSPHTCGGIPRNAGENCQPTQLAPHLWGYADYLHQGLQAARAHPIPVGICRVLPAHRRHHLRSPYLRRYALNSRYSPYQAGLTPSNPNEKQPAIQNTEKHLSDRAEKSP